MDTTLFAMWATALTLAAFGLTRTGRATRTAAGCLLTAVLLIPIAACGAPPPESPRGTAPLSLPTTTPFIPPTTTPAPPPATVADIASLIAPTTTVAPPAPPAIPAPPGPPAISAPPAPSPSAAPPAPAHVTSGAFCSTAGATGVSKTGKAMVCAPARDGRLRWQQA